MVLDGGVVSVCLHQPQTERADHWWFRKETQRLEKSLWSSVFISTKLNKWNIVLRRLKKLSLVLCSVQVITGRETTETCLVNHQLVMIDSLSYSSLFIYLNQTWRRFKPAAVTLTEWELLRLTTRCNHQLWFGQSGAGMLFCFFYGRTSNGLSWTSMSSFHNLWRPPAARWGGAHLLRVLSAATTHLATN